MLFYEARNKILGLTGNFLTWEMELLPHQQLTSRLLCDLIYDLISRFFLGPFSRLSWSLEQNIGLSLCKGPFFLSSMP